MKINKEQVFCVPTDSFTIGPSTSNYTVAFSADGVNFTEYKEVEAGTNAMVLNIASGALLKLVGNQDENVLIRY